MRRETKVQKVTDEKQPYQSGWYAQLVNSVNGNVQASGHIFRLESTSNYTIVSYDGKTHTPVSEELLNSGCLLFNNVGNPVTYEEGRLITTASKTATITELIDIAVGDTLKCRKSGVAEAVDCTVVAVDEFNLVVSIVENVNVWYVFNFEKSGWFETPESACSWIELVDNIKVDKC